MIHLVKKLISVFVLTVLISGLQLHAQEYIGGVITVNTTYGPVINGYIVTEPLIIPEGVTLTILPGTVMQFMIGCSIQVNEGILIAEGTAANPIIFEAYDPQGTNDAQWEGVIFNKAVTLVDDYDQYISGSLLKYDEITGTTAGITLNDSSVLLSDHILLEGCNYGIQIQESSRLLFYESTINLCSFGIYIRTSSNNRIFGCDITNGDIGIYFVSGNISRYNRIENNNISNHNNVALFLQPGASGIQYNYIIGNTFTYNNIGVHLGNGGTDDIGYNVVSHNIVQNNYIGIKLSQESDTINNNLVENNGTGIFLSKASYNDISNNIIRNCTDWGIELREDSNGNLIQQNNIYDNHSAIKITYRNTSQSVDNSIRYNSITHNEEETILLESGPQQSIEYNTIISFRDTASFINRHSSDVPAMNNFWGTTDTLRINSIISDRHDYPQFGEVIYKPFLGNPDPGSPISKPTMVVKRLVNNQVLVTWDKNSESDLAGYYVYIGTNMTQVINNSMDTSVVLSGIMLTETIRVTAYDLSADGLSDQYEGHESAFSLAIAGPYAGEDNSLCADNVYFTSNATAIDYESIQWITEGDGSFADESMLHTYYIPGSLDLEAGFVNISLKLVTSSGIGLFDGLHLTLLDYPTLKAGNDTTITEESIYSTETSIALDYTKLHWVSSGDGTFENPDTLITNYTPGEEDKEIGLVILTLNLSSICGELVDNIKLAIIPGFNISGTITEEKLPVSGAMILAHNKDMAGARVITTTTSDYQGNFKLEDIPEGDYYLYAVPDPEIHNTHMPTYYAERYNWQNAYLMPLTTDVYDVDIDLNHLDMVMPNGEGSISGVFYYDGEPQSDYAIYNQSWFGTGSSAPVWNPLEPFPAANHVVLLMNPDFTKVLGWVLTELDGTFTFTGLPYGSYRLWGEKAGFTNKISSVIYLTPEHKEETDIELLLIQGAKMIEANIPETDEAGLALLYPNPASTMFYINSIDFGETAFVDFQIVDAKGIILQSGKAQRISPERFGPVDISNLPQGIYFCNITTVSRNPKIIKLIVK